MSPSNLQIYLRKEIVSEYSRHSGLQKPEQAILARIREEIAGGRILDIGVGGGRTVAFLSELAGEYCAIDYSASMVEACRSKFPRHRILQCDAKDLSPFPDRHFDLVFFSFNGIDSVHHEDRLLILKEVYRVLAPEGYFVFSSHNKERSDHIDVRSLRLSMDQGFVSLCLSLLQIPAILYWRSRLRRHERKTAEYAIINDRAHRYRLLQYYIAIPQQIKQLRECGFEGEISAWDLNGQIVDSSKSSAWIYYCVKKNKRISSQ